MSIRRATEDDLGTLRELWEEFELELGGPDYLRETWDEERRDVAKRLREGAVLIAEEEGEAIGYAEVSFEDRRLAWLNSIYVRPGVRRRGVAKVLLGEVVEACRGRSPKHLGLELLVDNHEARVLYEQLGFVEYARNMAVGLDELEERLRRKEPEPSFGRVYAQTDSTADVERAVQQFVPRLGRSERTVVSPPRNGWIEVDDELCSREPELLRRLAQELSYRTAGVVLTLGIEQGAVVRYVLFDRGSVADEYASVPEYFGPLPPGDVVALSANPTVVHRLTGADSARVRAVARTADSPAELQPAEQLFAELAEVLGVAGDGD